MGRQGDGTEEMGHRDARMLETLSYPLYLGLPSILTYCVACPSPAGFVQGTSHGDSHLPAAFLQDQGLKRGSQLLPGSVLDPLQGLELWVRHFPPWPLPLPSSCERFLLHICTTDALCGRTVIWSGLWNTWGMQITTHPPLHSLPCSLDSSPWMELLRAINSGKLPFQLYQQVSLGFLQRQRNPRGLGARPGKGLCAVNASSFHAVFNK